MHLDESILRLYIDGELAPGELEKASSHLAECPECQASLKRLGERMALVSGQLGALQPHPAAGMRSAESAYALLNMRKEQQKMSPIRKLRPLWASLMVLLVLAAALSFQPVRALAHTLLSLFRVQQVQVVSLDSTILKSMGEDPTLGEAVNQLFSDSMTVLREHEDPQVVGSAEEAGQLAGFDVRLPQAGQEPSRISLESGVAFNLVVDRQKAQQLLDSSGNSHLVLPENVDGAEISVDVPKGVMAEFGSCEPGEPSGNDPDDPDDAGEVLPKDNSCLRLMQVPSPVVTAPDGLDLAGLAEIGLQFVGVEPAEAASIASRIDWATTLVIPVPHQEVQSEDVVVDGSQAVLLREVYPRSGDLRQYMLIWVRDGMLYVVRGYRDPQEGITLADSLQ